MFKPLHLKEAYRIFKRNLYLTRKGIKKYSGNDEEICKQIIKDCWNGEYFQTSAGHFNEFWMRDFGFCVEALYNLGYEKEIRKTLKYCLNIYSKNKEITTTITPDGKTLNVFYYSPDSLPLLLYSLRTSNNLDLIETYLSFLNSEIMKYFNIVLDLQHGYVKSKIKFSSMQDNVMKNSSCYNNSFLAMLQIEIKKINSKKKLLIDPFKNFNLKNKMNKYFWKGYFKEDLYSNNITGDAQVYPFWCDVFDSEEMFNRCLNSIQSEKLDEPFPLKYSSESDEEKNIFLKLTAGNYEGDTIWIHLGLCYLDVLHKFKKNDLLKKHLISYKEQIEKYSNFLELYQPDGSEPYKTLFYHADESMLWCSKYLWLKKQIGMK